MVNYGASMIKYIVTGDIVKVVDDDGEKEYTKVELQETAKNYQEQVDYISDKLRFCNFLLSKIKNEESKE